MNVYTYTLIIYLSFLQYSYAYFAYYAQEEDGIRKIILEDTIPEWNKKCFNNELYRSDMCNIGNLKPKCILFVHCASNFCDSNVIESYHEYAKYNDVSAIIFSGNPAYYASCSVPSTFINKDMSAFAKDNTMVEVGYSTRSWPEAIKFYSYGMGMFILSFACMLMCVYLRTTRNFSRITGYFYSSSYVTSINDTTNDDDDESEDNKENVKLRIIVNSEYTKKETDDEESDDKEAHVCAICLDSFEEGESVSKLKCGHMFKSPCIIEWLEKNPRCPLCNSVE